MTRPTELLTKDVLDHDAWRVTTPLHTLLDLARGDTTQEQGTAAVGAALEQGLTTVRRIRSRSDEAGDRAALRIERALGAAAKPSHQFRPLGRESDPQPQKIGSPLVSM